MLNTPLGSQIPVHFSYAFFSWLLFPINLQEKNCLSNTQPFLQCHHQDVSAPSDADLAGISENASLKHLEIVAPLLSVLFSQQPVFKAKKNQKRGNLYV